jgi:hypothetical protein
MPISTIFGGFRPHDFDSIAGTSWRNREPKNLGGALSAHLRLARGTDYWSWPVYGRRELHIASASRYEPGRETATHCAKRFVYGWNELAYGLYVEGPGDPAASGYAHWQRWRGAMSEDSPVRRAVVQAMADHGLILTDYGRREIGGALGGRFVVADGRLQWQALAPQEELPHECGADEIGRRLAALPRAEGVWADLHLYKLLDRQSAIDMKGRVVEPILALLQTLAPIYEEISEVRSRS